VCPVSARYIGVDFARGKGVDVLLDNPYILPFDTGSVDFVVSPSCLEHSEMFWLLFLEILRILKPNGLFYFSAPSNGLFHRHPVDCWRFYPDSGRALVAWAKHCGINTGLLESYTANQYQTRWTDFVAVFIKDTEHAEDYPNRILSSHTAFENVMVFGSDQIINHAIMPEDLRRLTLLLKCMQWAWTQLIKTS
jgi:SAM-dependent methyltransferase